MEYVEVFLMIFSTNTKQVSRGIGRIRSKGRKVFVRVNEKNCLDTSSMLTGILLTPNLEGLSRYDLRSIDVR